ncbi:MAG: nickel transporter [Epsilonproteobacteria bacterium]|nr:nickel transporter [Campylobacterota bacterium]
MSELYDAFLSHIIGWQKELNSFLTDAFDSLESAQGGVEVYGYILLSAFVYGLVHALGPGHGKMVIASYFLVHGSKVRDALKAGFLTALVHTFSALGITAILYLFFQNAIMKYFERINAHAYKLSAIFIMLVALFLLFETLKERRSATAQYASTSSKSLLKIAFSIGIVPCPGVMSIVLFSMILGYYTLGVASAMSMSVGMGITMSLAAIATTHVKKAPFLNRYKGVLHNLSFVGIALLFGLGMAILV